MYNQKTAHAITVAMAGTHNAVAAAWQEHDNKDIDLFFEKFFFDIVAGDPQTLTVLGIFETLGVRGHNAYLTPISVSHSKRLLKNACENMALLKTYDYAALTPSQQISYKFVQWELEHALAGAPFYAHNYVITQMFGALFDVRYLLAEQHPLVEPEDAQSYIARLNALPEHFECIKAFILHQKELGIVPPVFAIEKVLAIVQRSLPPIVQEHSFYQYIAKSPLFDEGMRAQVAVLLQEKIYPAYHDLQKFCQQLLSDMSNNNGVWALPNGDAYYAYALQHHTTTDLTADQIHNLGLDEVQKIHDQMRAILAQEGIVNPGVSVIELLHDIEKNPCFYYSETEAGRAECIADFGAILERCREELYPLFDIMPKASVIMMVVPEEEAEGAPAAYYCPANADGSRPGKFYINLRNMAELPKYCMETLAVHEAEPGHHFQITVQQEADLPLMRKFLKGDFYNAYVEGWALYTEKLAYEQGFYSSSWSKIGHLQDELLRAVRLVVDTGIHSKRWTREEAINYMMRELGMHYDRVVTEIERYFVLPGQACSYKIGQLKILELRQRAKDALGTKFDIRDFHNIVLNLGAAPLTVLEEVVDQYIQQKQ